MKVLCVKGGVVSGVVLADVEGVQRSVEMLHVGNVTAKANNDLVVELPQTLDVCKTRKRAVRSYRMLAMAFVQGGPNKPRLSAAITTPSLNLTAMTDVPVTMGCWVCWRGPEVWRWDAS